MPWVREGNCPPERCQGRCCEHVGTWVSPSPDNEQFLAVLETRGVTVRRVGMSYLVDYPQRCQWLTDRGLCSLHPAMNPSPDLPPRPDFCEEWPVDPSQTLLDPDCGYTFKWVEPNAVIDTAE